MAPFYLALVGLCLLALPVDGSSHSSSLSFRQTTTLKSTRATSTWNRKKKSPLSRISVPSTAFLPPIPVPRQTTRTSIGSTSRLAFLSHFVHYFRNSPPDDSKWNQQRHHTALFVSKDDSDGNSNSGSSNNIDDECSLQRLYQQVQEEDSEWYYQTFSKLLDEDPAEMFDGSCEGGKEDEERNGDSSKKEKTDIISKSETDVVKESEVLTESSENLKGGVELVQEKEEEHKTAESSKETVANIVSKEETELPLASHEKRQQLPELTQSHQQPVEEEVDGDNDRRPSREETTQQRPQQPSLRKGEAETRTKRQGKSYSSKVRRTYYDDDDEYEDLDEYDDYENADRTDRQTTQVEREPTFEKAGSPPVSGRASEPKKSSEETLPTSPPIIRLRNTYTSEIENLAPLPTLSNLGYSEKELVVLRPKVLELIVEDRIPKPKKGLPKRWVRLSKVEGYEDEVDEDDEDYGWEVEVISRRSLEKDGTISTDKLGKDEGEERDQSYQLRGAKGQESVTEKTDSPYDGYGKETEHVSEEMQSKSQQPNQSSSQNEFSNDEKISSKVSESWEPSTSSRVSGKRRPSVAADEEEDSRKYESTGKGKVSRQRQQRRPRPNPQQPLDDEDDDASYDRMYDDERDGFRRRPKPKRKQRDYDKYNDSRSDSPNPTSQRPRGDQQRRRQRQSPPGQRRDILIDRGNFNDNDDNLPPNKFWMDLPTFRDFLRKEAQLRLKILGPDWKETVLDESRWRYDLYKTWLTMLDEGVGGENPLYEYSERPPRPQQKRRSAQPRPRGEREYDRSPPRPRERQRRQMTKDLDEGYDENYDKPIRRSPRSNMPTEDERRTSRRRIEPIASSDRPPPRRGGANTWTNFSDLEESLQRSNEERIRPESGYSDEEEDEYYAEDSSRRRRRTQQDDRMNGKMSRQEEYDDSLGNESEGRSRRRSRARSSAVESRSRPQYSKRKNDEALQVDNYDDYFEEEGD